MLSQTLDEIMTKAKRFEHITRATKFIFVALADIFVFL